MTQTVCVVLNTAERDQLAAAWPTATGRASKSNARIVLASADWSSSRSGITLIIDGEVFRIDVLQMLWRLSQNILYSNGQALYYNTV
jgi:hypothetical protein